MPGRPRGGVRAAQGHRHPGEARHFTPAGSKRRQADYTNRHLRPHRRRPQDDLSHAKRGVPRQVRVRLQQNHARRQGGRRGGRPLRVHRQGDV